MNESTPNIDLEEEFDADATFSTLKKAVLEDDAAERLANFFGAFSDAIRLKIIHALAKQELCVHELSTLLGAKQSGISQHLKTLWQSRIVKRRKVGLHVFYRCEDAHIENIFQIGKSHVEE